MSEKVGINKAYFNRNDVKLIVFDFDGVMTDNRVMVDENGVESVFVSRADGQGISMLKQMGIDMVILSSEKNPVVSKRAEKLALPVMQGVGEKDSVLAKYCKDRGISLAQVLYVGNDINDLDAMKLCGHTAVPGDAHKCVKDIADVVLNTNGGYGVARELAELVK